ncbi:MAG: hypothetical protein IVW53_09045 [Chloroflexi bacterium]|nr:hypothetical protein [Chloroflexota bacterium]
MSQEEHHVSLPQLRGEPAYARPPRPVEIRAHPYDPDDLPLEVSMTDGEREQAAALAPRPYQGTDGQGHGPQVPGPHGSGLLPRVFRLRSIAERLAGGRD